jgi:hypothetical protein
MKRGRAGTMTHDYKRHGTATLFAALNVLTGVVIGKTFNRHRHQEFLRFLRIIDTQVPRGLQIHMICDNYGTHNHANVKAWLAKHPRFHVHFIPTSSSWLNQVVRHASRMSAATPIEGGSTDVEDVVPGPVREDRPRLGVRRG